MEFFELELNPQNPVRVPGGGPNPSRFFRAIEGWTMELVSVFAKAEGGKENQGALVPCVKISSTRNPSARPKYIPLGNVTGWDEMTEALKGSRPPESPTVSNVVQGHGAHRPTVVTK